MTLSQCTKADLVWVIEHIELRLPEGKYAVERALSALEQEKLELRYAEANIIAEAAHEKRLKVAELLNPYEGNGLLEVPASVLDQVSRLLEDAEKLDRKWNKLMGIEVDHND